MLHEKLHRLKLCLLELLNRVLKRLTVLSVIEYQDYTQKILPFTITLTYLFHIIQ